MSNSNKVSTTELVDAIVRGIQEVKGKEIRIIDLRNIQNAVTDYFVICHGTSDTQVEAIAREVEKHVFKDLKDEALHREGLKKSEWVLLDFFDVVVHIFKEEARHFYNLEKLWADADVKEVEYQV
jgi:ribosome-associated protein